MLAYVLLIIEQTEALVQVDDFDISSSKIGDTAQRIVDRAVEEARRREHGLLTNEHLFLAFAQVEWDLFADVMHDVELNPHVILEATEAHLRAIPPLSARHGFACRRRPSWSSSWPCTGPPAPAGR